MPADFNKVVYLLPKFSKRDYAVFMKTLHNSLTFDVSDAAKYRHHVLLFYYKHGWKAAVDAFQLPKSTLYDWKKSYEKSGKQLTSLIPKSTRPRKLREMIIDWKLEVFIKSLRQQYGNLGKYKIKPFLDEYAQSLGLESYGNTKIGKIIKRRHYFFEGKTKRKKAKFKPLSARVKRSPKEKLPGYIEMDSITVYILSKRHYFVTAIDVVSKFAWCQLVNNLSSVKTKQVLQEFTKQYFYPLRAIQTDNGSEFLGEFQQYLEKINIIHQFIYPRSPKINAYIERFNRTIQEEFIERCDSIYYDRVKFNQDLIKYLTWYNTKRPHHSLGLVPPIKYLEQYR